MKEIMDKIIERKHESSNYQCLERYSQDKIIGKEVDLESGQSWAIKLNVVEITEELVKTYCAHRNRIKSNMVKGYIRNVNCKRQILKVLENPNHRTIDREKCLTKFLLYQEV